MIVISIDLNSSSSTPQRLPHNSLPRCNGKPTDEQKKTTTIGIGPLLDSGTHPAALLMMAVASKGVNPFGSSYCAVLLLINNSTAQHFCSSRPLHLIVSALDQVLWGLWPADARAPQLAQLMRITVIIKCVCGVMKEWNWSESWSSPSRGRTRVSQVCVVKRLALLKLCSGIYGTWGSVCQRFFLMELTALIGTFKYVIGTFVRARNWNRRGWWVGTSSSLH